MKKQTELTRAGNVIIFLALFQIPKKKVIVLKIALF